MGERFIYLKHWGRKSGNLNIAVIEVIDQDKTKGKLCSASEIFGVKIFGVRVKTLGYLGSGIFGYLDIWGQSKNFWQCNFEYFYSDPKYTSLSVAWLLGCLVAGLFISPFIISGGVSPTPFISYKDNSTTMLVIGGGPLLVVLTLMVVMHPWKKSVRL